MDELKWKDHQSDPAPDHYKSMLKDFSKMIPAIFFEIDREGTLLFADISTFRLSNVTKKDVAMGKTRVTDLVVPEDRERMSGNIRKIFEGSKLPDSKLISGEIYRFENAQGERRDFRIFSTPVYSKGVVTSLRGIALDDTERLKAERDLDESRRRLNTLMNNLPGMAYRCVNDKAWTMLFVSNGARDLTGYSASELENGELINYADLVVEEDRQYVWDQVQEGIRSNKPFKLVYRIMHKELGERWVWEQGQKVGNVDNGEALLEGFITDITEKQKAEEDLILAKERAEQSDHLKTSFLANISHEIRTPLNAILGFSNLLHDEVYSEEKRKEYLSIIIQNGGQLLNLVNDIIDVSLIETGQVKVYPRDTDIGILLKELEKTYSKKKSLQNEVKLELDLSGCIAHSRFLIDGYRLKQIMINLLDNALKYTPQGKVSFGCRSLDPEKGELLLFVSDTGIGIPVEKQARIFERFYQVDNEIGQTGQGTGLGLAITRAYVDMMGGRIKLDSEPGRGTTFEILFNATRSEGESVVNHPREGSVAAPGLNGKVILAVEDQEHNMRLLEVALQHTGVEMIKKRDAESALEILKGDIHVDIVLMDIKLPGMDGLEATRQLRKIRPDLPVIAQTAYAMAGDEQNALDAGCVGYISKPLTKRALLKKLREHI